MEMRTQGPWSSSIGTYLKQSLKNLPGHVRTAAEQPEVFWQRQQAAIRSRIAIEQASENVRQRGNYEWGLRVDWRGHWKPHAATRSAPL